MVERSFVERCLVAVTFLTSSRDTHKRWAEWFEANPEKEAEYVATGVWDDAAEHRRLEAEYNQAIEVLQACATGRPRSC